VPAGEITRPVLVDGSSCRVRSVATFQSDTETLALRHQITLLERQLGTTKAKFAPEDRAFLTALLASLLTPLPRNLLRQLHLVIRPDTLLRRPPPHA